MTPSRMIGLIVVVFAVSLPASFLLHEGPSAGSPSLNSSEDEQEKEEKDDPVVDVLCLKGLQETSNGNFTTAIAAYTKAIDRDPKYSFAYIGRGDAYRMSGDLDRALADYERAVRLDSSNDATRQRIDETRKERARR